MADIYALYAQYEVRSFWNRPDLPAKTYLEHCLAAARELGPDYVGNFLDTSFLQDRETSVRSYLEEKGIDVEAYVAEAELSEIF